MAAKEGADQAARWVQDALASARGFFPDLSEAELLGPLEQAFALATGVARAEREFHEVFEAELRRAVEEREVVGSEGSVLPTGTRGPRRAFQLVGAGPAGAVGPPAVAEAEAVAQPEVIPERDAPDDRARSFALAVGALRFTEGLSPGEIRDRLEIDGTYYSDSMRWLLAQVDPSLAGEYSAHVDRPRMARFAAGLEGIEERFAVEQHVRECAGCATYLADLLDGAQQAVQKGSFGAAARPPKTPSHITYTTENAWNAAKSRRRPGPTPMSLKAAELRKYAEAEPKQPLPVAADVGPIARPPKAQPATSRRDAPRRRLSRRLVPTALGVVATVVVVVVLTVLSGGDGDRGPRGALAAAETQAPAAPVTARSEAQERRNARARARRAEHASRARAQRRAHRKRAGRRARVSERAAATPAAPATSPTPAAPSAPAVTPSAPATGSQPAPSGPSGEFGLEP